MVETGSLPTVEQIYAAWNTRDRDAWRSDPRRYTELAESALSLGHPGLAHDVVSEALEIEVSNGRLHYLLALALARSGSTKSAADATQQLIRKLEPGSPAYCDAVSLAGRIAKDRYAKETDDDRRQAAASASAEYYERSFRHSGDYFPGINAATMTVIRGDMDSGRAIARSILDDWLSKADNTADYWLAASIGEANLILGKRAASEEWYARARELAGNHLGDVASMRRQIKLLAAVLDGTENLMEVLTVPKVAAFAGHMIDAPDRAEPRFPPECAEAALARIAGALNDLGVGIGYASAACGGDLLFIEAMLERMAEVHVILPFDKYDFLRTSVSFAGGEWERRFERALDSASTVSYATDEKYLGDDTLFGYAAELIQGKATLHADQLVDEPVLIALADSRSEAKTGGTIEHVESWKARGRTVVGLDLGALRTEKGFARPPSDAPRPSLQVASDDYPSGRLRRKVETMLFADVVGFSKIDEEKTPAFFVNFLGQVASVIHGTSRAPVFCNTWGDGLFVVYDDIIAAASFALALRDQVRSTDWQAHALPANTSVRIGMHAGPVYEAVDPVLQRTNYFGSHVNKAARIEPVVAAGAVYASEQAACLLVATATGDFSCDYVGNVLLPKSFGTAVLYRLRHAGELE